MEGLKERLLSFIKEIGIEKSVFERTVGLSNGFVDKATDNIRSKSLVAISKAYPQLNIEWLKTGIGESIIKAKNENNITSNEQTIYDNECQPILDIRVCAGNGIGLEGSENKITEWVSIPSFKGCTGVTVYGDSMYDKFKSGDIIFVRPILGKYDIDYGQCYVVITSEDRYIKNLYESERGDEYITMVSYNNELNPDGRRKYPDRDILREDIKFLYKVVGKLRRNQL